MEYGHRLLAAAGCILPLVLATTARAQSVSAQSPSSALPGARPWTIEVHGGILRGAAPTSGDGQLPAYDGSFVTELGTTSPSVSSWYFGDGTKWLNSYLSPISSTVRMSGIDNALTSPALQRQRGPAWGIRVTRELNHHLDLDVSVDRGQGGSVLSSTAVANLQSGANAFQSSWRLLLSALPSNSESSALAVHDDVGRQTFATVSLDFVRGERRWVGYAGVGGGVAVNTGTATATLTGVTGFALNGLSALQTDAVTIRFAEQRVQAVGTAGIGLLYYATARSGVRLDARMFVRGNPDRTFVSTSPAVTGTPTVEDLVNLGLGVLQFSALPGKASTLGQTVTNARTFTGSGTITQLAFTVGYFFRF